MFNINKQEDVKDKAANLVDGVKIGVDNVTDKLKYDLQDEANEVLNMVHVQSEETKAQAIGVIESLKTLLGQYTSASNIADIKDQIVDKANQLKGIVKDEASHAYEVSRDRTVQTVQDKPIASLAVAVGAGVLLGYILGSKTHSNK
ncbi:MAG: hypothetical protein H7Z20_04685 [Bdellovibrio sp.]|nr:hypothetical protein [Methylotenera sp.]